MNDVVIKPQLIIRHYHDLTPYSERFQEMKSYTEQRDEKSPDQLWILQHHEVLTQGQAGKPEHILIPSDIPVVQSDRGGQVTWHGPGQMVVYFMFDLNRLKWNVRTLVSYAEQLMIDLLKKYSIEAYAKPDAPGVYVNERKIGSLGFKIRKGRSYHGLAGLEMVRIQDLIENHPDFNELCADIIEYFQQSGYFNDVQVISH